MEFFLPPLALSGALLTCLGELLHLIGLATPCWMKTIAGEKVTNTQGLFQMCYVPGQCIKLRTTENLQAVQAMALLGMICGLVSSGAIILFMVLKVLDKPRAPLIWLITLLSGVLAAVFIILGVILYDTNIFDSSYYPTFHNKLGYSFALCIAGGVLILFGSIMFYIGARKCDDAATEEETEPIVEKQ